MRRKVSQIGRSSLAVTLPASWVEKNGVRKGDEVDVEADGKDLRISVKDVKGEEAFFSIDGLDSTVVWRYMLAFYKLGFDSIRASFSDDKIKAAGRSRRAGKKYLSVNELMSEISRALIGMELVEESDKYAVFRKLAEINEKEYDNALRRMFLLVKQMTLENAREIDPEVNKLGWYCERILANKNIGAGKKAHLHHALVNVVEKIGDVFKQKDSDKFKELFEIFYDCYYNYSQENIQKAYEVCSEMKGSEPAAELIREGLQILIEINCCHAR